jgi:hypothetical protein
MLGAEIVKKDVVWYVNANGNVTEEEIAAAQVEGVVTIEYDRVSNCAKITAIHAYILGTKYKKKSRVIGQQFSRLAGWLEYRIDLLSISREMYAGIVEHDREVGRAV